MTKNASEVTSLVELDMPSDKLKAAKSKLCIDQHMKGRYVGVKWTHYIKDDNGKPQPAFLTVRHDGKVGSFYVTGLANAKKWIEETDAAIAKDIGLYPDIKDWSY